MIFCYCTFFSFKFVAELFFLRLFPDEGTASFAEATCFRTFGVDVREERTIGFKTRIMSMPARRREQALRRENLSVSEV